MKENPHALRAWIEREKINQTEAARRLGISQSFMSELISGVKRPSGELLHVIHRETGGAVTVTDFDWKAA